LAVGLGGWLLGPQLLEQGAELVERIPRNVAALSRGLPDASENDVISAVSEEAANTDWKALAPLVFGSLAGLFTTLMASVTGALAAFALAVFLALQPRLYIDGLLLLLPREHRARGGEVLDALGHALRRWLIGRLVAMAIIAAATIAGLAWLGVDQAVALGTLAGILAFVPYVGPIVGAVPAVIVAATSSLTTAVWVVALYTGVQVVESYMVTPTIEGGAVSMPPALLILAGVLLAMLFGILGVLLSTPLTVAIVVLVQALYVQDALGEDVALLGENEER
jgi:predicted PurR-regulated permease PerM